MREEVYELSFGPEWAKLTSSAQREDQFNMVTGHVSEAEMGSWSLLSRAQGSRKICKCPLEFTPARSSAPARELGFLTRKKHKCPNILDLTDANTLLPAIRHIQPELS